nr:MAG TPA: hypothetical protein [Crassvirales sp.]
MSIAYKKIANFVYNFDLHNNNNGVYHSQYLQQIGKPRTS